VLKAPVTLNCRPSTLIWPGPGAVNCTVPSFCAVDPGGLDHHFGAVINGQIERGGQFGAGRVGRWQKGLSAETKRPISGNGGDDAVRDLADAVVLGVGDLQVADRIHGDAFGEVVTSRHRASCAAEKNGIG
jgi:hypothetical protein